MNLSGGCSFKKRYQENAKLYFQRNGKELVLLNVGFQKTNDFETYIMVIAY